MHVEPALGHRPMEEVLDKPPERRGQVQSIREFPTRGWKFRQLEARSRSEQIDSFTVPKRPKVLTQLLGTDRWQLFFAALFSYSSR